jgi:hypothetical protein
MPVSLVRQENTDGSTVIPASRYQLYPFQKPKQDGTLVRVEPRQKAGSST